MQLKSNQQYAGTRKSSRREGGGLKNHPFVIPVLTFLVLFVVASAGMVSASARTVGAEDSRLVHLSINGRQQSIPTRAQSVEQLLERLDIEVTEQDIVEPAIGAPITDDNFRINVYQARPVAVVDGDRKITTISAHHEPKQVAESVGIKIYPEDKIQAARPEVLEPAVMLREGLIAEEITIDRATPLIVNLYGTSIPVRSHMGTVGDVLVEKNIKPLEGDRITPAPDTPVTKDMQIFITRLGKTIDTKEEAIPMPTETVDDPTLPLGASKVREQGKDGKKLVTYEIKIENEVEVARRVIQEVVVEEPVKHVVAKGSKVAIAANLTGSKIDWMTAAGISPADYAYVDYIIGRESGWCPTKWQGQYGQCPSEYVQLYSPSTPGVGYGLCQSTPAGKMASAGADWATNPVTQMRWCNGYATGRYGSWQAAYNFWVVNHWW